MDDTTKWIMVALLLLLIGVAVFLLLRRPGADDETSSIAQDGDGSLPQATSAGSPGAMTEPTSATDPYDQDRDAGPGHPAPAAAGTSEEARYEEQDGPVEDEPLAHDPDAHDPVVEPVSGERSYDPVVEEPVTQEPAYDPVVEEPAIQEPVSDEPAYDPVVEEPAIQEPVSDEPAYDPVVEEPVTQEPVSDEPAYDPVVEEPVTQEPVSDEPAYDPVVEEPVTQQPAYDEPLTADEIGEADEAARREEEYPVGDAGVYRAGESSEPEPFLTPTTPADTPAEESFAADAPAPDPDPEPEPAPEPPAPAQEPTFAESVYGAGSAEPLEDGTGPSGWAVKGNSGSMLFHTPESPSWDGVRAEVWFESEDAARAAGFAHWDRRRR